MRFLKSNPIFSLLNSYLIDSPQPANISYMWNFGSLLGICLLIQILTGVFLAMHYTPNVDLAFISVEHIMRDVNSGWFLRYTHANVASFFFLFLYFHTARGLYYSSYKTPRVLLWSIGVIILILTMAIAFLGNLNSPKWNFNANFFLELKSFANNHIACLYFSSCLLLTMRNIGLDRLSFIRLNSKTILIKVPAPQLKRIKNTAYFSSLNLKTIINELNIKPEYIFENLNLESTKQEIVKLTKGLSGIYMILNKVSQDYYIGSASTNRFYARFSNHLIHLRGSKIIKCAVKKYKLENFVFIILELYPKIVTKENNKELLDLEDKYLKLLLPNYNILTEAGSTFGYKHTEVDRKKIKDLYTDARRELIGSLNRGQTLSSFTKSNFRLRALNRGPLYPCGAYAREEYTKKKCKTSKAVVLYNLNRTVYGKYSTLSETAKAINCKVKTIKRSLKTEKKLVKKQWIVKRFSRYKK